jgi:hypothetical protein
MGDRQSEFFLKKTTIRHGCALGNSTYDSVIESDRISLLSHRHLLLAIVNYKDCKFEIKELELSCRNHKSQKEDFLSLGLKDHNCANY